MLAHTLRFAAALATLCFGTLAGAQPDTSYPEKAVRVIVPFGPGNSYDHTTRYVAEQLQRITGQGFVVEPKQGAVGNIAASYVARAPGDGYTVLLAANSTHSANQHLFKELGFDPVGDFAPVTTLVQVPQALIVSPTLNVKSPAELIELVRSRPDEFNYGSSSATGRVAVESFLNSADLKGQHVGYKTTSQAVVDLASGQLHFMFTDVATAITNGQSDKVKVLAVTSAERLDAAPDLPTMAESGLPGYEFVAWLAFVVPDDTPPAVVQKLAELSNRVIEDPATRKFLANLYIQPYPGSPEQLRDLIASDTARWGEMIRAAGLEAQ